MKEKKASDWVFRFIKGMFIGTGAILPGVSGGALAAVFGIYEQMILFMADLTKDFKKNFLYFLPVGFGGIFGIFLLSFVLSFFFETSEVQLLWFFIGCIMGIFPSLIKEAGKKGRKLKDVILSIVTAIGAFYLLVNMQHLLTTAMPLNFGTWVMAGAIFGLGLIVPGLSPSNFLVYLEMYQPMTDGIKDLNFSILIPLGIGLVLVLILLSKLMSFIFEKAYSTMFHFILGIVVASTVMIIPFGHHYIGHGKLFSLLACILGVLLGSWMSKLEDKYKN